MAVRLPPAPADALRRLPTLPLVRRMRRLASTPRTAEALMLALGAAVGLATGLFAVALIALVDLVQHAAWGEEATQLEVLLLPALGGLAVGLLAAYWAPEARGAGVGQVMTSIALHGGRMRARVAPAKLLASALAIGTGSSGGREGPIALIGGGVGSTAGRLFALDEEQKRALIAAGAGAGIAASFNAPIGGMLFALEVIIGGFRARYLQVVVVASVVASVTAREIIGERLIYQPPPYRLDDPRELGLYVVVGLVAVGAGLALIHGEHLVSGVASRLRLWAPLIVALGGLGVGLLALAVPEVLGTGDDLPPVPGASHDPIAEMLDGTLGGTGLAAAGVLALLGVAKYVATCLSVGTGSSVGSFAPSIFIGAAAGGAVGHLAMLVFPGATIRPGALALAGAAAVVASGNKAPLAAILISFELTGDYGMVLPLMLAVGIATVVTDRIEPASLYTLPLLRRGIVYAEPEDVDIMQTVRVGEIMTREPATVPPGMSLGELARMFRRTRHHGFPVADGERLVGVVTLSDLTRAAGDVSATPGEVPSADLAAKAPPLHDLTVADICTRRPLTVTPSDPVFRALRRMANIDVGRLPVVSEEDHGRLVGLVRRSDVVKAYQRAVTRNLGRQQRSQVSRLRDLGQAQFVELVVTPESPAAGQAVRDLELPARTILTGVRRRGELVMPNGATVLQPGDDVVVLTDTGCVDVVRRLLTGGDEPVG